MSSEPTRQKLKAELHTLRTEGGGMLELEVIRPSESAALLLYARAGSERARQTLTPVMSRLCGSCPRAVRRDTRFSIVVAWPSCDDPTQALALAICKRCASDHNAIQAKAKATTALRRLWPNLTPVRLTHPDGGRA